MSDLYDEIRSFAEDDLFRRLVELRKEWFRAFYAGLALSPTTYPSPERGIPETSGETD